MTDHLSPEQPSSQPQPETGKAPRMPSGVWQAPIIPRKPRKDRGHTATQRLKIAGRLWTKIEPEQPQQG